MSRVYPGGLRVSSSNFDPFPFWEAGMQMVALNFQSNEMQLRANRSLFTQARVRVRVRVSVSVRVRIRVRVRVR